YRRPALALDLDQAAHDAVRLLLRVIPPPRPRVAVIHAYVILYWGLVYPGLSEDAADATKEERQLQATQAVAALLAAALAAANVPPEDAPAWDAHIQHGSPRIVVEKAVKKNETDL